MGKIPKKIKKRTKVEKNYSKTQKKYKIIIKNQNKLNFNI